MSHPSELVLSKIVLGAMGFSEPGHAKNLHAIHAAIDQGMTTIDTAPLYGAGESERLIGQAIAGRRDKVQLLTKCGLRWDTGQGEVLFSVTVDGKPWAPRKDSRPKSISEEIDLCLGRLKTDYIDLMQVHHLDRNTPIADTMGALKRAQDAGKIREIGVSNFPVAQLAEAHNVLSGRLYSTQNVFNMLVPKAERDVLHFALQNKMTFLAYTPLGHGVLAGRHLQGDQRNVGNENPYWNSKNLARVTKVLVEVAQPMARSHGLSLGQLTLLWTISQPGISCAIAGGRTEAQILDCAGALTAEVPQKELDQLGQAMLMCRWDPTPAKTVSDRARNLIGRGRRALARLTQNTLGKPS